ncbi:MAG TPA: LTA synthase family protein [Methylomirabilota bacterium]
MPVLHRQVRGRQLWTKVLQFVLVNCAVFAAYRVSFIRLFGGPKAPAGTPVALWTGLGLDAALLALELGILLLAALVTRRLRLRFTAAGLWGFTCVNALVAGVNLFVFHERHQHLWEIVPANIGRPHEMLMAFEPFASAHPFVMGGGLLALALAALAARRYTRPLAGQAVDLWRPAAFATAVTVMAALLLVALEIEPTKANKDLEIRLVSSLDRMRLGDYVLNQVVGNPLQDLVRLLGLPDSTTPYQLDARRALDVSRRLLGLPPGDPAYPLLRSVRGQERLGIRNVVVIMVEGLSAALIDHRVGGELVMPYVHGLCEEGLCFRKMIQSFSATDGSVFAILTSLPPPFALSRTGDLPAQEINGLDGSLARSIGAEGYRHLYIAGFRQRSADFVTFMGNQGYRGFGYDDLRARLGDRTGADSNALGVFDGPMLLEAAGIILAGPRPFTAHMMTATTHSPWTVPASTATRSPDEVLATFQYLDRSVRDFIEALRLHDPDFEHALVVVTGDHTSQTFDSRYMERLRVPLILAGPALARAKTRWASRQERSGSHLDIVPTVLGLLDGTHLYSGMGRNLLADDPGERGLISGAYGGFLYIKDRFVLRYTLRNGRSELFRIRDGDIVFRELSDEEPNVKATLRRELLALSETADRLGRERRIFPTPGGTALVQGGGQLR